jgi:hypothetical protein
MKKPFFRFCVFLTLCNHVNAQVQVDNFLLTSKYHIIIRLKTPPSKSTFIKQQKQVSQHQRNRDLNVFFISTQAG